jgi:hypothetical protein
MMNFLKKTFAAFQTKLTKQQQNLHTSLFAIFPHHAFPHSPSHVTSCQGKEITTPSLAIASAL